MTLQRSEDLSLHVRSLESHWKLLQHGVERQLWPRVEQYFDGDAVVEYARGKYFFFLSTCVFSE